MIKNKNMINCKLTVEVPLLLCYLSFLILGGVVLNLNMYKTCYIILNYPEANCSRLGRYTDNSTQKLEKIVQPYAGTMTAVTEMGPCALPIIISLMIGSWSDKYGRKPVLLLVLMCEAVSMGVCAIMLLFNELNPWWLMIASIPIMMCGGLTTFFTVTIAYLSDLSTPENRALRMVRFDIIQQIASLIGGLSSSYLLYATSYASVYGICSLFVCTALVYAYFCCPESLKNKSNEKPNLKNMFSCKNLTELFKTAGKEREYHKRAIILLIISALGVLYFIELGEGNVQTLYLRSAFKWTLTKRNVFGAWTGLVGMVCTFAGTYVLHKKFKVREIFLVTLSLVSKAGSNILYAVGTNDNYIYTSVAVGVFGGIGCPLLKSMLAQLLVPEEMGKMFSLVMVLNTLSMLLSSLSYQQVYNMTINSHPEAFNYVSMGLLGVIMIMIIIVLNLESRIPFEKQNNINQRVSKRNESVEILMNETIS